MTAPAIPPRRGPRPRTTRTSPHSQLDQHPPTAMVARLADRCFALPDVAERSSLVSVPGARALHLAPAAARGPAQAFMAEREFAHIHPLPDGSLHLALPPATAEVAAAAGWAEPHPLAMRGLVPPTVVMVYAPRDAGEVDAVFGLVRAAYEYARGERA